MLLYFSHSVRSLRHRGESRSGPRHSNRPNSGCVLDLLPLLSEKVSVVHFKGPTEDNEAGGQMSRGCGQSGLNPIYLP